MRSSIRWLPVALAVLGGCSVNRAQYQDRAYSCEVRDENADQSCGDGWSCVAGNQVGANDFCAPACTSADDAHYCTADAPDAGISGGLLTRCDPTRQGCQQGFNCVRSNFVEDRGLCLPVPTCGADVDCRDPVRGSCLSDAMRAYYRDAPVAKTDHMSCLQNNCSTYTPCEAGFTCLADAIPDFPAPAFCVPNCDHERRCPQSYRCASKLFRLPALDFCVLGMLGYPCNRDDDCMVGSCVDVGNGTKACSIPCTSEADCTPWDTQVNAQGTARQAFEFHCSGGQCVTATSAAMRMLCVDDSQCASGYKCLGTSTYDGGVPDESQVKLCLKTCATGADCTPVSNEYPNLACTRLVCAPGVAGASCAGDEQCIRGLSCLDLGSFAGKRCSIHCTGDADCQNNPWGDPSTHCRSGMCTTL